MNHPPFVDIHNHCIFGVDDGAQTQEQMSALLHALVQDGIGTLVSTPHITPGVEAFNYPVYRDSFALACEQIRSEGLHLRVYSGHEVLWTDATPRMVKEGKVFTLGKTRCVLVEFSPDEKEAVISQACLKLAGAGYTPVVAHMERYLSLHRLEQIAELRNHGALMQVNGRSLIRKQPLLRRNYFRGLFAEKMIDFVATDTHAFPGREPCMTQAYEILCRDYGQDYADALCHDHAIVLLEE